MVASVPTELECFRGSEGVSLTRRDAYALTGLYLQYPSIAIVCIDESCQHDF